MAMSRCCFFTVFGLIIIAIIAAITVTVIKINGNDETAEDDGKDGDFKDKVDGQMLSEICQGVTNRLTPNSNYPTTKKPKVGVSKMAMQTFMDPVSRTVFKRNAFWLTGDLDLDRAAMTGIKSHTCQGNIPVIAIRMRPSKGLVMSGNVKHYEHYKPELILESWAEYDKKLAIYLRVIANIPSVVIMEPDLLMYTYDKKHQQFRWQNEQYEDEFLIRVQRVVRNMPTSWVYVDAGNAEYLSDSFNMDQMAKTLLRMEGIRGFTLNSMQFFNTSYNNKIAMRLHCKTGLHFIVDTGRNGGAYSRQAKDQIQKCLFDPPHIKAGSNPGWSWGVRSEVSQPRSKRWVMNVGQGLSNRPTSPPVRITQSSFQRTTSRRPPPPRNNPNFNNRPQMNQINDIDAYNQQINSMNNNQANNVNMQNTNRNNMNNNNGNGGFMLTHYSTNRPVYSSTQRQSYSYESNNYDYDPQGIVNRNGYGVSSTYPITSGPGITSKPFSGRSKTAAGNLFGTYMGNFATCVRGNPVKAHDGNIWLKTAGESDGRMYEYGTFHKCLIGHSIACTDKCKMLVVGTEDMPEECDCEFSRPSPNPYANSMQNYNNRPNPYANTPPNSGGYQNSNPRPSIFNNNNNQPLYPQSSYNTGVSSLSDLLQAAAGR